jgi:hypothetical protein
MARMDARTVCPAGSVGEHLSHKQGTAVRFCGWVRTPMRRVGILLLLIDRSRVRIPLRLLPDSSVGRAIKRKPRSTSDSSNPRSRCFLGSKHCRRCSGLLIRRTRFDSLWSYQRRCAEASYFVCKTNQPMLVSHSSRRCTWKVAGGGAQPASKPGPAERLMVRLLHLPPLPGRSPLRRIPVSGPAPHSRVV